MSLAFLHFSAPMRFAQPHAAPVRAAPCARARVAVAAAVRMGPPRRSLPLPTAPTRSAPRGRAAMMPRRALSGLRPRQARLVARRIAASPPPHRRSTPSTVSRRLTVGSTSGHADNTAPARGGRRATRRGVLARFFWSCASARRSGPTAGSRPWPPFVPRTTQQQPKAGVRQCLRSVGSRLKRRGCEPRCRRKVLCSGTVSSGFVSQIGLVTTYSTLPKNAFGRDPLRTGASLRVCS